ncbi:PDZ domain-containing protein [Alkalihalobacillus trypoxylicola]|uniref:PDZ domain-containing protein n=1 Tax=Alkalihalobacillus trypoxylicola TaxID=519424 RepID=A0A162EU52_9BACI|nr:PDZ domain-containing protein [Alkalihalobacillus trypoxylicola]KYG33732.1 hypothetical protein AZF04_16050 [Alkalihalobacillus trypoxylicola]
MLIDILITVGITIGSFFMNPLFYLGLLIIFILANQRVNKERNAFNTRVFARRADIIVPFWQSLIIGLVFSIITAALGIVVSLPFLILLFAVYFILAITTQIRWISPVYALGIMIIILSLEPLVGGYSSLTDLYNYVSDIPLITMVILLATLLLVETILVMRSGHKFTSPNLQRSKRGKWVGQHEVKRLWVIPVVLFIPNGIIPTFDFWPVISLGETQLQPVLVPFLIGFHHLFKSNIPAKAIKRLNRSLLLFSVLMVGLTVTAYFFPIISLGIAILAILAREAISFITRSKEKQSAPFFTAKDQGCTVLGILPGSPAEKMSIKIGETITKVNGQAVHNEHEFYEALQLNSAFCKLEVKDYAHEVRFAQGALYVGEHHQLGVLLVKTEQDLQDSVI